MSDMASIELRDCNNLNITYINKSNRQIIDFMLT